MPEGIRSFITRKVALEDTFYLWLRNYAPEHFRRSAFSRYPDEYSESSKRDKAAWLRRNRRFVTRGLKNPDAEPLHESGRMERRVLSGTVSFGGSNTRLTAKWPTLPAYAARPNLHSAFNPSRALVTVSDHERAIMARAFHEWVAEYIRGNLAARPKSRGRIVITV